MPRRNKPKYVLYRRDQPAAEKNKVRYATKQAAERGAAETIKYQPDLHFSVYQSPIDGGWYLTSQRETNNK